MQKTQKDLRRYAKVTLEKSSKIISFLIIFLLLSTVLSSVVSSDSSYFDETTDETFEEDNAPIKEIIQTKTIKEKIEILKEKFQILKERLFDFKGTTTLDDPSATPKPTDLRLGLLMLIKEFLRLKEAASNLKFYTNYDGIERESNLKLFRTVPIDVNFDGKDDIKVKLQLFPFIERRPLSISANFKIVITRLSDFPDINENFSGYFELYFPGLINKNMMGDRVRIGYESPKGEEVPVVCTLSYMYQPYLLHPRLKPAHTASIDPLTSRDDTKLVLLLSYTNFQGGNISSELISRTIFNPAVESTIKLRGTGPLGGSSFEFSREMSDDSDVDLICSFKNNGTTLYGYAYDIPKELTFIIDFGKEGYIEFDTCGDRVSEVGLCDDLYNPINRVYFSELPDYAVLEWDRRLLLDQKVFIRCYTNGTGVAINAHLELANNSVYDLSLFSNEPINCNMELDTSIGRLIIDKTDIDLSFMFKGKGPNGGFFNLSFDIKRSYSQPFEIYYGKLTEQDIEIKFFSENLQIDNLNFEVNLSTMDLGMKADRIYKNNSGNVTLRLRADKVDKNITFNITMIVENSLEIYGFSVGFNGFWTIPRDIILEGTVTRIFEITIEGYEFEYFIADDWSWGYFHFKGSISYQAYRTFEIKGVSGGYKGKIYAGTSEDGLNISWYTDTSKGYAVKKLNVTGFIFGLEDFHFYYGEIIDIYVPEILGSIEILEVCNESGYVGLEIDGGGSFFDLDISFNFTGSSGFNFSTAVNNFHIDIPDTSVLLSASWDEGNLSLLRFLAEGEMVLTLDDFDLYLETNGSETFAIENMTASLEGYAGFDVNLTLPLKQTITNDSYFIDFSDDTFSVYLENVDAYLYIERVFILFGAIEGITIDADVTGSAKFSLLNIYLENSTMQIYEDQVNTTKISATLEIDAQEGQMDLNLVYLDFSDILTSFGLNTSLAIKLENAFITGYSKFIGSYESLSKWPLYFGIRFENAPGTAYSIEKMSIMLNDIFDISGFNLTAYIGNILLAEGNFEVGISLVLITNLTKIAFTIKEGSALQSIDFGLEALDDYITGIISIDAVGYMNFELNNNLSENAPPFNKFIKIDTQNTSASLDGILVVSSDFINLTIDYLNTLLNISMEHQNYDRGITINNISLTAEDFCLYYNPLAYPKISGYLNIASDGNITILEDGQWTQLLPGGDGFSLTVETGHIQVKYEMAVEDYEVDWEGQVGESYVRIGGSFTTYCENLTIDIFWNLLNEYLKISSSIDAGFSVDNFYFMIDDNVEINWDNLSLMDGNFTFLFENTTHTLKFLLEGSTFLLKNLECNFELNQTITINIGSLSFLGGEISISTVPGSQQWNIQTLKDVYWFELADFNFTINNLEAGVGLISWDKKTQASFSATLNLATEECQIRIDRDCDFESEFTVQDAYIKYIIPNINLPIGGRLRSMTLLYQKSSHGYFYLDCKKDEYIDLDVDFAANWNFTFERFFDIMNYLGIFDMVGSSVDGNFSMHYVPPADNDSAHHLELDINDVSTFDLFELRYRFPILKERVLTIGSLEVQPGHILFEGKLNENTSGGWILIDNDGATFEFEGITLERDNKKITLGEVTIYPGETYIDADLTEKRVYIDNTAIVEFTLFSVSEEADFLKIEKENEVGIITMKPGQFLLEWCNLTGEEYDKQFNISNGVFEFTLAKVSLNIYGLEFSLSLGDTDSNFENEITVKLRLRGSKNNAIYINTEDAIQFDALTFGVSTPNWYLELDFVEIIVKLDDFYIGYFDDNNLTHGGNITIGINRFFNLTFNWKDQGGLENELFLQYENEYGRNSQAQAIILDTEYCYENLDIYLDANVNELDIVGTLTIYPQKYLLMHFDLNPTPRNGNIIDGHLYVDTDNENIGNLDIIITRYISILNAVVGLDANVEFLKAQNFHIFGEFITIGGIPIPNNWDLSGTIDVISLGEMSFIYNTHVIQLWPCEPIARLDKSEYGVTNNYPDVVFDTSESNGFMAFPITQMRWDFNGDGIWENIDPLHPNGWIGYEESVTQNFVDFLISGEESVQIAFQVRTALIPSDIIHATIKVANDLDIEVLYDGEKLYEFENFDVSIVDSDTKLPLSGATVKYYSYDNSGNPTIIATNITNSNGLAGFTTIEVPITDPDHRITCVTYVEKSGYLSAYSGYFEVYDTIVELRGFVRDIVTYELIHGALITAEPGGYYCYTQPYPSQGPFSLLVPPGTYTITASKAGYTTKILFSNLYVPEDYTYYNVGYSYLSPTTYGGLNGTVKNAITGNGIFGAKVTVELPGDDLISYTFYDGYFPSSNYNYHSFMLNPGTYTVTVTKSDFYSYTTSVNIVAGQVLTLNVQLQLEWVSPDGYSDPNNGWFFESKAYDDSLSTRTESKSLGILEPWQWSETLTFTRSSSVSSDKMRFYAFYHADYCNKIHIDVYYGGSWHVLYEGAFSNKAWVEKTLGGTYSVSKVRVRFYYKGCLGGTTADLYELDFHKV